MHRTKIIKPLTPIFTRLLSLSCIYSLSRAAKDPRATLCFKYMLMCKVMNNSREDFQALLSGKFGLKYSGESHIKAIKAVS